MEKSNKKFNLTVAAMWQTRNQNLMSMEVDAKVLEALASIKPGGKFMIKFIDEDKRKNDKSPHAYIEFIEPEEVAAYKAKASSSSTGGL